jgi:hypothetical protein
MAMLFAVARLLFGIADGPKTDLAKATIGMSAVPGLIQIFRIGCKHPGGLRAGRSRRRDRLPGVRRVRRADDGVRGIGVVLVTSGPAVAGPDVGSQYAPTGPKSKHDQQGGLGVDEAREAESNECVDVRREARHGCQASVRGWPVIPRHWW